ncbi:hypothetical protein DQ04_26061000, partial [Trypanosoma grayi]|uniref:hypothetical protein n=1 Tax=Trypanosoma grayi TaxID=71804 RepID=UPI0004F46CC8
CLSAIPPRKIEMLNNNNNVQRVWRLLGVTLLLLVHCAGSTLAVTEHHRCIYDYVSHNRGDVVTVTPIYSTLNQAVLSSSSDLTPKMFVPPDAKTNNKFELPSSNWRPLRVKVFMVGTKGPRTCATASGEITTTFGSKVSCTKDDVLTAEKRDILE